VDDLIVTLSVKPNRPGQNVFTVFAASARRPPPAEVMRVIFRFKHLETGSEKVSIVAEEVEPSRYMAADPALNLPGRWQIEVVVRREGLEDAVAVFEWVLPTGQLPRAIISRSPLRIPSTVIASLLICALVGAFATVWLRRLRRRLGTSWRA
jgi:copper transport protein